MAAQNMLPASKSAAVLSTLEIWGRIIDLVAEDEPHTVYRLRSVSGRLQRSTDRALAIKFDIDRFLRPLFGENVPGFRAVQRSTGALVAGSCALAFFQGARLADMGIPDIVVPSKEYLSIVFFLESIGFIRDGPVGERCLQNESVVARQLFVREDDETCSLYVISTPESPIATVLRSDLTIMLNFIGWDRAISIFPLATFCHKEGLVLDNVDCDRTLVERYRRARGYALHEGQVRKESRTAGTLAEGTRHLGDRLCWILRLAGLASEPSVPLPYAGNAFAVQAQWRLRNGGTPHVCGFSLKFDTVEHAILRYAYAIHDACAVFVMICIRHVAKHCPDGPNRNWCCYFQGGYEDIEISSVDELVPMLIQSWMTMRSLNVGAELLTFRFDPELLLSHSGHL